MDDLGKIVRGFVVESRESLDRVDRDLADLDRDPGSRDPLSRIFRALHTIKGTSGFLAFTTLETVTHAGESLLARLRDGVQPVTPDVIATVRAIVEGMRALLAAIEETGGEHVVDRAPLIAAVRATTDRPAAGQTEPSGHMSPEDGEPVAVEVRPARERVEGERRPLGEMLVEAGAAQPADVSSALQQQLEGDHRKLGTILLEEGKAQPAAVHEALRAQEARRDAGGRTVPVDAELLDGLMNLVGELVLARNQVVRGALEAGDTALIRSAQRLGTITGELQQSIAKTRMQRIDHIWSELPRAVRSRSDELGKQVRLVVEGRDIELDRSLLEALKDPLTLLVGDAVENGVEEPERREAAGKPREGTLTLRAYRDDGQVAVEVEDDGSGTGVHGLAHSVAEKVERVGGALSVDSTAGEGTRWRLTVPLTPTIIQALTVDCGEQRYVVPQVSVVDLVFIDGRSTRIEYASGAPVYRLRGEPLPLVRTNVGGDRNVYLVVLQAEGRRFGLVVDRVRNTEEVVVKALNTTDAGRYAGATILSDGKVGLILDVPSLARHLHPASDAERQSPGTVIQQQVTELLDVRRAILAADPNADRDRAFEQRVTG